MGIIRYILALSVVSGHSNSSHFFKFVGGETAVELFFMISGFYMTLVIKNYKNVKDFYLARYLRLLPTYFFVLLSVLYFSSSVHFFNKLADLPQPINLFMIFTNLTMLFQDLVMFIGIDPVGNIHFTKNFFDYQPPLFTYLLIPQGWSLGLELSFYMIAPYLLRVKTKFIIAIICISFLLKYIILKFIYYGDPWTYRFFPAEIGLFLLGSLAFRIGKRIKQSALKSQFNIYYINMHNILFCSLIFFILIFNFIPINFELKKMLIFLLMFSCIYYIFDVTKNNKFSNFIGNLSYPIYCCHIAVLSGLTKLSNYSIMNGSAPSTLAIYLLITFVSILIYFVIEQPVEKYRKNLKSFR